VKKLDFISEGYRESSPRNPSPKNSKPGHHYLAPLHSRFPHLRDGPLFFWRGEMKNPEKNCLQNQKSPNKLFAGIKRRK